MIHLITKEKMSDLVKSWLQDATDAKGEYKEKEFCHAALREVANQWQVPMRTLLVNGYLKLSDGKKVNKEELKLFKLTDEVGGELVLGEVICMKLQDAYAIVRLINREVFDLSVNDWCRKVIEEKVIAKSSEVTNDLMLKEEKELYSEEEQELEELEKKVRE